MTDFHMYDVIIVPTPQHVYEGAEIAEVAHRYELVHLCTNWYVQHVQTRTSMYDLVHTNSHMTCELVH